MNTPVVAITGVGAVSALAKDSQTHDRRLREGDSGIVNFATTADSSDRTFHCAPSRQHKVNRRIQDRMLRKILQPGAAMAVAAAGQAIREAGLEGDFETLTDAGLFVGSGQLEVPLSAFLPAVEASIDGEERFSFRRFGEAGMTMLDPAIIVKGLPNAGLCGIATEFRVTGPNVNFSDSSMSGIQAVVAAAEAMPPISVACVCGYDSLLLHETMSDSQLNDANQRSGSQNSPGEGAAACVLETLEHAVKRRARILALISGCSEVFGASHDARSPLERATGLAMRQAGRGAGWVPEVVFGELNRTDNSEELLLADRVLKRPGVITSAVGAIGDTRAASGVFSLVHAVRAIADETVPPTTHLSTDHHSRIIRSSQHWRLEKALVWSRSDDGGAVSLALEKPGSVSEQHDAESPEGLSEINH